MRNTALNRTKYSQIHNPLGVGPRFKGTSAIFPTRAVKDKDIKDKLLYT
jgi:hypothetical protein